MYCVYEREKITDVRTSLGENAQSLLFEQKCLFFSKIGAACTVKLSGTKLRTLRLIVLGAEVRILIFDDPAEFWMSQRPRSGSCEGKLSNARGRAARARCMIFFRKFTKSRAQPPRGPYAPVPYRSSIQYEGSTGAI
jgi:hypothetical protein